MVAGFLAAAWRARFVMDEFAQLQGARYMLSLPLYHGVDPIKTVLATEVYAFANRVGSSVAAVRMGRVLGMMAAMATLLLISRAARALWPRRGPAALTAIIALSFSNVFERAFRIRTDTIALPLAAAALVLLLRPDRRALRTVLSGVLLGASFLCTQKAVYFFAAFLVAMVIARGSTSGWRQAVHDCLLLAGGWCAPFLAYAVWLGGKEWPHVVVMVLAGPQYILNGTASYSGLNEFIIQTLERNVIPYGLCLAGLAIALKHWRRSGFAERFTGIVTLLVAAFIFAHDQPWPYVFVWAQVLLALWVLPLLEWASAKGWLSRRATLLTILLLAAFALPRQIRYLGHTNRQQLEVMADSERLLEPGDRYFDGIGMVVDRRIAGSYPMWWWDVPNLSRILAALRKGDDRVPREIIADHPKLWIMNYRLLSITGLAGRMIAGGYVRVSPSILLTGAEMGAGSGVGVFNCRWPGRYQLFDVQGCAVQEPVSVDGASASTVAEISAGTHRLARANPGGRRFLLPVGAILPGPLASEGTPPDLYAGVYTF
jgi:hypothetical protein